MKCPNCGLRRCPCTWEEKASAIAILKRRGAERRRQQGIETVIERDHRERRERIAAMVRKTPRGRHEGA